MERNYLQPNNTHNASFAPNMAPAANQQQQANPQARPVPPLGSAADLSSNPAARNLQTYNTISTPKEPTDTWNAPEHQPIQPGLPYMEKLADEAANTKVVDILLKHAREKEELGDLLGDFKQAEEAHENLLKYTENTEHYKLYATCLQKASTALKDATKANVYKEKAARAFYYLGDLYKKQEALQEAHAAYQASCDLALYEAPLKALVDVARHLGEATELAAALEKLADFYAQKGAIALAIEKLKEAFEVGKITRVLEKLEALYSGEGNPSQMHEVAIQRFELQISQDPKNIGLYRKYAWFLKDIGRKSEARVVKERMDGLQALQGELLQAMQQKLVKQKNRIRGLRKQVETLEKQVFYLDFNNRRSRVDVKDADFMQHLLEQNPDLQFLNLERCKYLTDDILRIVPERFENLQELNLRGCKRITEVGLDAIAENASKLKHLSLDHCPGTTIGLLRKLNAKGITFTLEGVVFKRHVLNLSNNSLTDAELLKALEVNSEITELDLTNCTKITDAGLAPLKNFQWLTSLNLTYCNQFTDAGLQHLATLTELRVLRCAAGNSQITDAGLQHLSGLTQLNELDLRHCKATNEGVLRHLSGLTQLTKLYLLNFCPNIHGPSVEHLKQQIPGLSIL